VKDYSALQEIIGYRFRNEKLLRQALTHASLNRHPNNQRLEFLGDSVLGMVIAELLYARFPKEAEGALAKRKAALVSSRPLSEIAQALGLDSWLMMTEGESQMGGRQNPSNLEDACEALIGALYLDGGLEPAKQFILRHWEEKLAANLTPPKDPKSTLQEWTQSRTMPLPVYETVARTGPSHAPQFTVRLMIEGLPPLEATAGSKRIAEQQAAAEMLQQLQAAQQ
jgi:ribonuclease-3